MKSMFRMFCVLAHLSSAVLALVGCTAQVDGADLTEGSEAALADPNSDEDLLFIKDNGFGGTRFMASCVSRSDSGPTIESEPLPVGGDRYLECVTAGAFDRAAMTVASSEGEHWCALGQLSTSTAEGDPRLHIQVVDSPSGAPWTVRATADSAIEISRVEGLFGALTWPVWLTATYATTDLRPESEGVTCEALFGL
jgi:hypothetical protein